MADGLMVVAFSRERLAEACEDMYDEGFYVAWSETDVCAFPAVCGKAASAGCAAARQCG